MEQKNCLLNDSMDESMSSSYNSTDIFSSIFCIFYCWGLTLMEKCLLLAAGSFSIQKDKTGELLSFELIIFPPKITNHQWFMFIVSGMPIVWQVDTNYQSIIQLGFKRQQMQLLSSLCSFAIAAINLLLIALNLLLSPLCIISSSLYDWALQLTINIDEQTLLLIMILTLVWGISAFSIFDLIRGRSFRTLFFYQFVFYLTAFNSIFIGATYSFLRRENLIEEVLAKIFSTLLMVYLAERLKSQAGWGKECKICFGGLDNSQMVLACHHSFHEDCLWNWFYVKTVCPVCFKPHIK